MKTVNLKYPYGVARNGATATSDEAAHVEQMIEQLLFTAPGERVMRPTFGCGLRQLLFEPNGDILAAATQMAVQGSLQQWLGSRIDVIDVDIIATDSRLDVTVTYSLRRGDQSPRAAQFSRSV
jgi:phage baseplate assembly protein W